MQSELIERSVRAGGIEAVHRLCDDICAEYGFDHFIYGARLPSSLVKPLMVVISGYPDDWRARYAARRYLAIDPTVAHCAHSPRPLQWSELLADEAPERRAFMGEAREFGLVTGASLPVRGGHGEAGMLSFSMRRRGRTAQADLQAALPHLFLLSAYVHEAVCRIAGRGQLPFQPRDLTARERECLLWAAEGKTSWETAQILGIAERTVTFHLGNVVQKLNVSSRQQAIARAVSQGLITPQMD